MSHSEEPSPKRQRRSYSPPSPQLQSETKTFDSVRNPQSLPQTPPPSVHMSPSWQSQHPITSAPGSTTFPTPPSTTGFSGPHTMERGMSGSGEGMESGQYTPMTDNEGRRDVDGDAEMKDSQMEGTADPEHRRTDHERSNAGGVVAAPKLYLLHTKPIVPSRPHPSQDMISLYSLEKIQASVARRDAQGNKINKLRKSYENKVKQLGLYGRTKAEVGQNAVVGTVDPNWEQDIGGGTTMWEARCKDFPMDDTTTDRLLSKLDSALAFAPGQLPKPEHQEWKSLVAMEDNTAKPVANAGAAKPAMLNAAITKTAPATMARASAPASPKSAHRPDRAGKKRRYDESSYDGYHGYDDDGYSTGGPDDRRVSGAKRQKRKVSEASTTELKIQGQKRKFEESNGHARGVEVPTTSSTPTKKRRKA